MNTSEDIVISFRGVNYSINLQKLEAVLSFLENKNIVIKSEKQLGELLIKYDLYDEFFLKNINNI